MFFLVSKLKFDLFENPLRVFIIMHDMRPIYHFVFLYFLQIVAETTHAPTVAAVKMMAQIRLHAFVGWDFPDQPVEH